MSAFMDGILIGFSIAAPVGPIGMLCIKRTLSAGRLCGLLTGLGAATADGAYGLIAAAGLTALTGVLLFMTPALKLGGAAFLAWMGWTTIKSDRAGDESDISAGRPTDGFTAFGSSLILTLTNPMTILSFIAIMGSFGQATSSVPEKALLVAGVWAGSCLWWLLLTSAISTLRIVPGSKLSRGINVVSGIVLMGFAVKALI